MHQQSLFLLSKYGYATCVRFSDGLSFGESTDSLDYS